MIKYLFAKPLRSSSDQEWLDMPIEATVFTYHKKHAARALLGAILLAATIEATVIHILFSMWNDWIAWIATVSTAYFGLQIIAQIRATAMRPIYILPPHIHLRNGAFDLADISICQVASVEKSLREVKPNLKELKPLNVSFPASHNVILRLKEPAEAKILNRSTRNFQIALLAIDEPDTFVEMIRNHLQTKNQND